MVLIHYKKTELNQFLYECNGNTPNDQVIKDLVEINNMRIILDRLACAMEDLATNGPLKPEDTRGLSEQSLIDAAIETMAPEKKPWAVTPQQLLPGQRLNPDKTSYRTGVIQTEELSQMVIENCNKVKQAISKNLVDLKQCLTTKIVQEQLDLLRGCMMICYPGYHGLPPWEPAREILEGQYDTQATFTEQYDFLDEKNTSLWWAGKELLRGKLLQDFIGKNDKTKIIVRLQKTGGGAPVREPAVDAETQKKMMAFYYKKQQEQKELEAENEDQYLNSQWANPKQLKQQLMGASDQISWKPK
ncbi:unnamed protein product [Paramecium primaurelia]|uniref:Cilia- and flagella-associated protein 298 n=2 Tax=Paramecium TaxID=5884 RepID=A0A8S1Y377_9CILI|nr:unnamed protein product [Paramecium primaurelia]CAD8208496.1 unnamed protein product [Paramecium pentaurelia]